MRPFLSGTSLSELRADADAADVFEIQEEGRQSGALCAARPSRSAENSMLLDNTSSRASQGSGAFGGQAGPLLRPVGHLSQSRSVLLMSFEWPRFSLENDAALDQIPPTLVDGGAGRMQCDGDRCAALVGMSTYQPRARSMR
jgi:hypothetical protein